MSRVELVTWVEPSACAPTVLRISIRAREFQAKLLELSSEARGRIERVYLPAVGLLVGDQAPAANERNDHSHVPGGFGARSPNRNTL